MSDSIQEKTKPRDIHTSMANKYQTPIKDRILNNRRASMNDSQYQKTDSKLHQNLSLQMSIISRRDKSMTVSNKQRNTVDTNETPLIQKYESVFTRYLELNNQLIKRRTQQK